jgi:putative pyruvate formate lyase activating enzyme
MKEFKPGYVRLGADELARRAEELRAGGACCTWCPRHCGADRLAGEDGACGMGREVLIASAGLHFGEEAHFVGSSGSGTVFFSGCNLGCVFCQNYDISHQRGGMPVSVEELARVFLSLQGQGALNLNLVTPSHYPADILAALAVACGQGLELPLVWNSGGYDSVETLRCFEGVVDIYMPDFKFASDTRGARYTQVADYSTVARVALAEMVHQVGPGLTLVKRVARRGMSVRHLVLPGCYENSRACMDFLHSLGAEITVNIMEQYRPAWRAREFPELNQRIDFEECQRIIGYARSIGLRYVLEQG